VPNPLASGIDSSDEITSSEPHIVSGFEFNGLHSRLGAMAPGESAERFP
jgi:hypothetical protein